MNLYMNDLESDWNLGEQASSPITVRHFASELLVSGLQGPALIRVCNMAGQIIQVEKTHQAEHRIATGNWPSGVYLLSISDGQGNLSQKVILP